MVEPATPSHGSHAARETSQHALQARQIVENPHLTALPGSQVFPESIAINQTNGTYYEVARKGDVITVDAQAGCPIGR